MSADPISRALAARLRQETLGSLARQQLASAVRTLGFFPRPTAALAAGDVPSVTVGADWAASTINGKSADQAVVPRGDPRLTYVSGVPTNRTSGFAWAVGNFLITRGSYLGANDAQGNPLRNEGPNNAYEFVHTGTVFEVPLWTVGAGGTNFRVLVNDCVGAVAAVPITGGYSFVKVQFPTSATRRIRIETYAVPTNGVNVASSAEIAGTGRSYPLVSLISDSFNDGAGADIGMMQAAVMGRALGVSLNLAPVGGTGLINPGGANYAGFPKVAWHHPERIKDLTLAGVTNAQTGAPADPQLGIVCASINDESVASAVWSPFGASLQAAITNRAEFLIDAWQAARPGKPLVLFGPTWISGSPTLNAYRIRDGIAEAAWGRAGGNVWFIDRLMPRHREGVWNNAADQASLYTGSDGVHPTPAGHRFDGLADAAALRGLILSELA